MSGLLVLSSVIFGAAIALGVGPLFTAVNQKNRAFFAKLEVRRRELGMPTDNLRTLEIGRWVFAIGAGVTMALLGLVPVGVLVAIVAYNIFGAWLIWQVDAYQTRIRDQLVLAARDFSNQVRAGLSLTQGLEATSRDFPSPLGPLLRRVVQQSRQDPGYFLTALENLKETVRLDGMTVFVTAVTIAHRQGGNLSVILDRLGHSLEELQRVERKKDSETAAGRLVVLLLSAFPFAFLALFYFLDPEATGLLFSFLGGQIVLSVVGLMVYGSYRWAQSILRRIE